MQLNNLRDLLRAHVGRPCAHCGQPMEIIPVMDHITPVRFGESLLDSNKVVCCQPCRDHKAELPLKDWLRKLRERSLAGGLTTQH
jgi:hypothetical protein